MSCRKESLVTLPLPLVRCHPNNFTPLERTPWAGGGIWKLKKPLLNTMGLASPQFIGESWEVSSDATFTSHTAHGPLPQVLSTYPEGAWGLWEPWARQGSLPLLLKWLEANEPLSVQVHPPLSKYLGPQLSGKHESWLVLDADSQGHMYLGFREGVTPQDVEASLVTGTIVPLLYKFTPQPFDYIAVPPGCVHAIGPNVLVAEPQVIWPGCSGITYRLFDWNRRYNSQGVADNGPNGHPRTLHPKESLANLDWSLPRGNDLKKCFVQSMTHQKPFYGNSYNSFPCAIYNKPGCWEVPPLAPQSPTLFTVWSGSMSIVCPSGIEKINCGESGLLPVFPHPLPFLLEGDNPKVAFFSLDPRLLPQP